MTNCVRARIQSTKFICTRKRGDGSYDILNILQTQSPLFQDFHPHLHQLIVIRYIARCQPQLLNAGLFGKGDPDFRDKNALKIARDEPGSWIRQYRLLSVGQIVVCQMVGPVRIANRDDHTVVGP